MAKVGYQLIRRSTGRVVAEWGGVYGQSPEIPNPLVLPNGDAVCGTQLGSYGAWDLVEWHMGPSVEQVREEEARRIVEAFGARDFQHCVTKQLNMQAKFNRLNRMMLKGGTLTAEQEAELDQIEAVYDTVDKVRAAADVIKAMEVTPEDFTDAKYWDAE